MLPLRWKLVLLYAAILITVIVGFSQALTVGLRRTWIAGVDAELDARARALGEMVENDDGAWIVERKAGLEATSGSRTEIEYSIRNDKGEVLITSPLAEELGLGTEIGEVARDLRAGERHYRGYSTTIVRSSVDEDPLLRGVELRIDCGKDMAAVDAALSGVSNLLWILGPAILLASLSGGWFLVGIALRPIEAIARTASEIGSSALDRRIEVRGKDELARLATTLNATFDRLQAAVELQARFTADASHELRTPLAIIAGNVELASNQPRSTEEYRRTLLDIGEASRRMGWIIENLLALARADEGSVELEREPVALESMCEELVRLSTPIARAKEVSLALESEGGIVVPGDRKQLEILVSNLISNAIRYNRRGGSVTVRLARSGDHTSIAVHDTGIGIPAEDLPRVFERFYRVDPARSREHGGSGLGLAIARWIAGAHEGELTAESELGKGSTFEFRLRSPART